MDIAIAKSFEIMEAMKHSVRRMLAENGLREDEDILLFAGYSEYQEGEWVDAAANIKLGWNNWAEGMLSWIFGRILIR